MTKQEFQNILDQTNTFEELSALRHKTGAPAFVSQIKDKIADLLQAEGYQKMYINVSVLFANSGGNTNAGDQGTFIVPQTSLKFKDFRGKTIHYYVNAKNDPQTAVIYFKVV